MLPFKQLPMPLANFAPALMKGVTAFDLTNSIAGPYAIMPARAVRVVPQ